MPRAPRRPVGPQKSHQRIRGPCHAAGVARSHAEPTGPPRATPHQRPDTRHNSSMSAHKSCQPKSHRKESAPKGLALFLKTGRPQCRVSPQHSNKNALRGEHRPPFFGPDATPPPPPPGPALEGVMVPPQRSLSVTLQLYLPKCRGSVTAASCSPTPLRIPMDGQNFRATRGVGVRRGGGGGGVVNRDMS